MPPESELDRRRYLKLKSVLQDRTTGLPALPLLLDPLRTALDTRRRLGVLHVEIENLDIVESLYGWQVFDRILQRVARELRESVGAELPRGSLIGINAVAGDRFAAFLPEKPDGGEVDPSFLTRVRRKLRTRLEQVFAGDSFSGLSPRLEFRTGQSTLSQNPFYRFERRVYGAVEQARAFDDRKRNRRELSWGDDLQKMIRDAAVTTVFQPVVELRSRELLGHEALARGPKNSPFETPQSMFALSSRVGVSAELDRVCRDSALRASAGMQPRQKLFINMLPLHIDQGPAFHDEIRPLLEAAELEPRDLVLEFSERSADQNPEQFLAILERFAGNGFGLALDDVGTGYSGQAIFESVKPDYLKLDISLVRNVNGNLIKQELLRSLVRIADRIGAAVIAEGVETEEELSTLVQAGARYGQGYLFAAPAPASRAGH